MDQTLNKPVRGRPFQPGNNANPRGRPLKDRTIEKLCRAMTSEAVDTLKEIMLNGKKDGDRREAAKVILQYGWGRPRSEVEITTHVSLGQMHLEALKQINTAFEDQKAQAKLIDVTPELEPVGQTPGTDGKTS